MSFENIEAERWKEKIQKELKEGSWKDLLVSVEDNLQLPPYLFSQDSNSQSLFESHTQFLEELSFPVHFGGIPHGTISQFEEQQIDKGFVRVYSLEEAMNIEQKTENEYRYLLDVYYWFERQQHSLLSFENQASLWATLSDDFKNKIYWVVDVSIHADYGANDTTQLALAFSKLNEMVSYFTTEILNNVLFQVSVGSAFLKEIAKLRALHMLNSNFCKSFNFKDVETVICSKSVTINKSTQDVENNLIRSTLEVAASILGGANFVQFSPYNLKKEDTWAYEQNLKQGLILSYESLLNYFNDALAGSYMIENLSHSMAENAWKKFQTLEQKSAYSEQYSEIVDSIHSQLSDYITAINAKEKIIIGLNKYEKEKFKPLSIPKNKGYLTPYYPTE